MTSHDEPGQRRELRLPEHKSAAARYLFALVATTVGLVVTLAIFETDASDQPVYAPIIGGVVLASLYGGFGPALMAIALGWGAALALLVNGSITGDTEDVTRWWINLAVALFLATFGAVLRARTERTADVAVSASTAAREIESLHRLSIALSGSLSSSDVAEAVTAHAAEIVAAQGAVLGLVEGEDIVIVDPAALVPYSHAPPVGRLPLDRATLVTRAARDGAVAVAVDRASLEERYPDSAGLLRGEVRAGLALPVRAEGKAIGAIGFLFDREGAITDDAQTLAGIAADLVGQALERARLYERERESRRSLDRILRVAPRFLADDPGDVLTAICREARRTFGADYGVLWRIGAERLELLAIDPHPPELSEEMSLPLDDFPLLAQAIRGLETSFVPDVLETTSERGHEFVRSLGIRSSLRTPVVISGRSELVLAVSWQMVVSEPDPPTVAVVRRFADQAGLALEQLERRRAEAEAALRADDTRRLQEVTAALSLAATPVEVSNTCLEHALDAIGAEAGFVVLDRRDGRAVEVVAAVGYDDDELEAWRAVGLEDDVPFAQALASEEPVWALSRGEMSAYPAVTEARSAGWITLPLSTRTGTRGALHLSLRTPRTLSSGERDWLTVMVAQCTQALERSGIYAEEQRSRLRAELLQGMTALLSNALTPADVATVVVEQVSQAVEATLVALAGVSDGQVSGTLAASGEGEVSATGIAALLELDLDGDTPVVRAVRSRKSVYLEWDDRLGNEPVREAMVRSGQRSALFVPLVAGRRTNGLLVVSWDHERRLMADERMLVEALAGQAAQALDRASHFESEQAIAETLQRSVLPVSLPRVDGVELAARYLPGSAQLDVGGDWFDALELPDGKLGLVVGDVVGKGVQAAASMAQLRNAIRAFSIERLRPSSVLARLNLLAEDALDTSFATVGYIVLDPERRLCRLSCAGHPPPVVAYPDGRVELLEGARGLPLGTGGGAKYRQETIELPVGSVLVLYTDGLVERRGHSIDEGLADLQAAVAGAPKNPDQLLEHILEHVVGARERSDDIALLAARVLPVAPQILDLELPARLDSMDLIRDALRAWLGGTSFQRGHAEDVVLATWEACANAIEHAAGPTSDHIRVHAEIDDSVVRVVVEDNGRWVHSAPEVDRGLGLRLIGALMSTVEITESGEGTRIAFEKAIPGGAPPVREATRARE